VLRYIGELSDLQHDKGIRSKISRTFDTALGGLKGSDSSSKYTQNHMIDLLLYKELDGSAVTAREAFLEIS
jgi:hypothetical protein